nr:MgtC/SapB family protein [uncultured Halomonas sp.]
MSDVSLAIVLNLGAAWLAGSLIGLERSYHGRPAGFRTHALVCGASAMLMLVSVHQGQWMAGSSLAETAIRTDPTRMAQGIMTGIGFLGAGVIFKEGLTVRGLTTAASIWVTSALGILFGIGFFYLAIVATIATLVTLSTFRWVENRLPSKLFADHMLCYAIEAVDDEAKVRRMITEHGCTIKSMSYSLGEGGALYRYHMVLQTNHQQNLARLAAYLRDSNTIQEYRLVSST